MRRFKLSEQFLESYKTTPPPFGPVGEITFKRTYARQRSEFNPNATGIEDWWETCRRVVEGTFYIQKKHCISNGLPWNDTKAQRTAKDMYDRLFNLKWTPPGRGLWIAGTKFCEEREAGPAALNNCAFKSTQHLARDGGKIFTWMMDALMLGIGVGFDDLGEHAITIQTPEYTKEVYVIPDTREGWIDSTTIILDGLFKGNKIPVFDYSQLRKKGEPIRGFGGIASGPDPLIELHEDLIALYTPRIGQLIEAEEIGDTANLIGRCVVSGNVRRSAELFLGSKDNKRFALLKQDKEKLEHHRWCSNNSINAEVGMDYAWHAKLSATNGEPGYVWLDNWRQFGRMQDPRRTDDLGIMGVNPCAEQGLWDEELCTLSENFISRHDSLEDLLATLKVSYLYAKTITLTKTHWAGTNSVMGMNRRIGLSMTGITQACNRLGHRQVMDWLDQSYNFITKLDEKYSDWLCVPRSKKRTTVKPSGTVSKLPGVSPGAHWPESEYYIQRIRIADNSELIPRLQAAGYHNEPCAYQPNTIVFEFPIKEEHFSKSKAEVSMWEQLELAAQLQYYWSDNGVSITVTFKEEEAESIPIALEMYEKRLKSVSFLRYSETGYKQAPWEAITQEEYIQMTSNLSPLDLDALSEEGQGEKYCTNDSCEVDFSTYAEEQGG